MFASRSIVRPRGALRFSRLLHRTNHTGRPPLPPLPRVLPKNQTTATPQTKSWKESWQSGSILLTFGYVGVFVLAVDRYLQYQQYQEAQEMVRSLQLETLQAKQKLWQQYKDTPPLYQAQITHAYKNMGGTYGLQHVQLHDTVEVLEEGVGPQQQYHLCRILPKETDAKQEQQPQIGWYPRAYLQPLTTTTRSSIWQRLGLTAKSNDKTPP